MKKWLTVLSVLIMLLPALPCIAEESAGGAAGIVNPVAECASLEEINEKTGVRLLTPAADVSNERFSVIDGRIAQYECEISGKEWTFRGACITDEDISGVYSELNEFIAGESFALYTNEYYLERFFDGDRQYTVVVTGPMSADGDVYIDEEEFTELCMELENIQKWHMDDPLVGDYDDTVSERMTAYVERHGDVYNISVNWSDSVSEYHCWSIFDAALDGDRLTYLGEEIGHYLFDDEGNEVSAEVTNANNIGWFELRDGLLYWTGAAQEECRECVFQKAVYEE